MASAVSLSPRASSAPLAPRAPDQTLRFRRALGPLAVLLAWQMASSWGWISPRVLAAPSTVVTTGWQLLATGELQNHLLVSLDRVARGLGIGVTVGLLLAVPAGLFHSRPSAASSGGWRALRQSDASTRTVGSRGVGAAARLGTWRRCSLPHGEARSSFAELVGWPRQPEVLA